MFKHPSKYIPVWPFIFLWGGFFVMAKYEHLPLWVIGIITLAYNRIVFHGYARHTTKYLWHAYPAEMSLTYEHCKKIYKDYGPHKTVVWDDFGIAVDNNIFDWRDDQVRKISHNDLYLKCFCAVTGAVGLMHLVPLLFYFVIKYA